MRYSDANGLSQNTVLCALQDRRGFMWFGTQDGLNRFDGYNFRVFKNNPDDSTSLSENWIWTIYEDRAGHLWIGTFGGGVNRFDPRNETFVRYRHNPNIPGSLSHDTVWSFAEDSSGGLWVATNNGLNRFNSAEETFTLYTPPVEENNVFKILPTTSGTLLLTLPNEALEFDPATSKFALPYWAVDLHGNLQRGCVAVGKNGEMWLGTTNAGLVHIDTQTRDLARHQLDPANPNTSLPDNQITAIHVDSFGVVWAGTREGLALLNTEKNSTSLRTFRHDPLDHHSLSHNYVFSIYESRTGEVWIGTRSGLNRFDRYNQKFRRFTYSPNDPNTLSHSNVLPIITSRHDSGIVWVGTNAGLNRLDLVKGRSDRFFSNSNHSDHGPAGNYILSLLEDRRGHLWIGTRGHGLSRMISSGEGGRRFVHYRHDPDDETTLGSDNVHFIYEDRNGIIWFGTGGGGLNRLNAEAGTFKRFGMNLQAEGGLRDSFVYAILEDRLGRMWIGTSSAGLHLFDRQNETFTQFAHQANQSGSLSNNRVLCIFQSALNDDIWIGTAAGLNKLVESGNEIRFRQYRERDGLPNAVIYGIVEDESGDLWISTNAGLCRLHFTNGTMRVKTYTVDDGLQSNEFNQNSFHRGEDGVMYFGGINGFNAFHPDSVQDNPRAPAVVITDFKIFNRSAPISRRGRSLLGESITTTQELALSFREAVFEFEFAALNFTLPEKNQYAYQMEGFDSDWVECGTRRFATYTNLDPGKYVFRVKASNNDGVWNEHGAAIGVTINPPWWQTLWAYVLYAIAFVSSVVGFVRYRIHVKEQELQAEMAIERARREECDRVRKKISADFHDEAGNFITKINLLAELARRHAPPQLADYLQKIEENTKALSGRMRDFIWALDPEKDSLHDTLTRIKDFGSSLFEHSEIRFRAHDTDGDLNAIILPMEERRELVLIFKEAMHNCLKHGRCRAVTFESILQNGELLLALTDDGVGFDPDQTNAGYGLQNMKTRARKIGGTLEIISGNGEGTTIRFRKRLATGGREKAK